MGRGVNLGQMFESTQHPRTLAAASAKIDAYYARGFRNLRIPITWTEAIGGDLLVTDATTGESESRARTSGGDPSPWSTTHSRGPICSSSSTLTTRVALKTEGSRSSYVPERLWQVYIADIGDRDHRLLFEILNEPHREDGTAMPAADLRTMTGLAYDKIERADAERIILFGGNQWFAANEVPTVWTSLDEVGGGTVRTSWPPSTARSWTFCGDDSQGTYDDAWTDSNQSGQ